MDPFAPVRRLETGTNLGILGSAIVSPGTTKTRFQFSKLKGAWAASDKVQFRSIALEPQQTDGWQFLGPRWPPKLTGIVNGTPGLHIPKKEQR